jgi:hypothetical protein
MPMEVRMQTRLARSWSALRYDLSSQRALDNAARMIVEHDRLLDEIDALARRIDEVAPAASAETGETAETAASTTPADPMRSRAVA